mgnify:CR=1 FL=1
MGKLDNKVAIITGGNAGVGKEIAKLFASEGAKVVISARRQQVLEEAAKEIEAAGGTVLCVPTDISKVDDVKNLVSKTVETFGQLDILINNAGFGTCGCFTKTDLGKEISMIHVNVRAMHILFKKMLCKMEKQGHGRILNVASSAGLFSSGPYMAAYYASKAYVVSLTKAVAEEIRAKGSNIYVGALCPGPVDTEFNDRAGVVFALKGITSKLCVKEALLGMKKRKVIIDCDPGIDDSLAIMLALKSPEIEVIGITIVCGNSPVEMGFGNAKKILKQMNRLDVPVYIGESTPLRRDYVNALDTHGEDGLGESFLPEVIGYQQQISAVDFLADVLKKEKVSIIELAPMTNLARLIQKDKEAFSCIEEIVSMGGSFKSHGNCSPVAEYNYWCDPDGASLVYETLHQNGQKIHMVGLDVTRKIVLTPDLLEYMCRLNKETGEFVKKITKFYFDFHWEWEHIIGCVINDPLAVAYFINPELCKGFDSYVQIETEGISLGQSVVDSMNFYRKASNARVLTEVDVYGFFQMFLSRILDQEPEKLDILQDLIRGDLK